MAETMAERRTSPTSVYRHPLYAMLIAVPMVCFVGALLTDLAYQGSGGNLLWVNFSTWLLAAGLASGAIAGLILLIEAIRSGRWLAFLLLLAAWLAESVNSLVHARDGWTAVVPLGLTLSVIASLLIVAAVWFSVAREGR